MYISSCRQLCIAREREIIYADYKRLNFDSIIFIETKTSKTQTYSQVICAKLNMCKHVNG